MKKHTGTRRSRRGFTLMEVLLVLAILVIVGGLVTTQFAGTQQKAKIDAAKAQIDSFKQALRMYNFHVGTYPPASDEALFYLIEQPTDLSDPTKWGGPYLDGETIPMDPWEQPYQYEMDERGMPLISSGGPDMQLGTEDDVVSR